ncbi:MAG: hypothetical protein EXR47_01975 [Dehalococcoidia bacterium]|nr:hypothetical protein [Dehalococcoidia bacterium]
MPEAPDLQVIKEFLQRTLTGVAVTQARVLKPMVLRSLAAPDFSEDIAGRAFTGFWRKGKLLGLELASSLSTPCSAAACRTATPRSASAPRHSLFCRSATSGSCGTLTTTRWAWSTTCARSSYKPCSA